MADGLGKWFAETAKYFARLKAGGNPQFEKMEKAAEEPPPKAEEPPPKAEGKSNGKKRDIPRQKNYNIE